jgi:hypothetical protein
VYHLVLRDAGVACGQNRFAGENCSAAAIRSVSGSLLRCSSTYQY